MSNELSTTHNLPSVGSQVKLRNPVSKFHGKIGTVVCHQLFNGRNIVGVLFPEQDVPVGCFIDELVG